MSSASNAGNASSATLRPPRALAIAVGLGLTIGLLTPQWRAGEWFGGLSSAHAADLTVGDGVIIKFAPDTQLVVRDKLVAGKGVTLTSQRDDSAGGQTGSQAQTAAAGDWRGMRLEKSASVSGAINLDDWRWRFAGALDSNANPSAALTVRGWNPTLSNVRFWDNILGLRLEAAKVPISNASFLRNGSGLEADANSAPSVNASELAANTIWAINNITPATVINASGNWWGNASGPKQATSNPQGLGDNVSDGVNFVNYLAAAPLINPTLRLAQAAAPYYENHTIQLALACLNATEYRIAESTDFTGVLFQSFTSSGGSGQAQLAFTTSDGEGRKNINVQYRNGAGTIVNASLSGGVFIDSQAPSVTLLNPATGSFINQDITLEASASDATGIAQLQFFLDNTLLATRTSAPYTYAWSLTGVADGAHVIRAFASDGAGRTSEQSVAITVGHVAAPADTDGPLVSNISANGSALADGAVFTRNSSITLAASDRSGVAKVELLLDSTVNATAFGGGTYSATFNLDGVVNGAHTLALRATDSVGNVTTRSFTITVAHAVPNAPLLSQPTSGQTTRNALQTVTGSAIAGNNVQLLLNGQPAGAALIAGNNGNFSGNVTIISGVNQIQATTSDQYGTSALSNTLTITLDLSVPASPSNLAAVAQVAGKVHLTWVRATDPNVTGYDVYRAPNAFAAITEAVKVNSSRLAGSSAAFDDLPPQDATWFYRVVSVNNASTASQPSNLAQASADNSLPRAVSIVYTPLGRTDTSTGRIGQGRVNLVLTTSEALPSTPFLSIVPQGGVPISVELVQASTSSPTIYNGSFLIDANTPAGTANALFSARDAVGNRGTDIGTGATLKIDTQGPDLSGITLNPVVPIKNDGSPVISATLVFSKAPVGTPQVSFILSGAGRTAQSVGSLTPINPTTFQASFTLPSDGGQAAPENLSFRFQAKDDLENISTKVSALNSFQVYQGSLPPLLNPTGFSAKAQPGGKVKLAWQAVDEAFAYQLYRQAPGQTALQALARAGGIDYIDPTPQDGSYKYAVASVRQRNGQEAVSSVGAILEVRAIATAPSAPQGLNLQLTGQGIYASWQLPASGAVDYYNLYRASGTVITDIAGLTPIKTRIKSLVTYDTSPSPTQGAYVVTAVDTAGNESLISNSAYLNASLLPVRNLQIEQIGNDLPKLSWQAPNSNLAGYLVYVTVGTGQVKLTPSLITDTSFIDTGYSGGERTYSVAAVDSSNVELARSILLPSVSTQIVSGLPLKRGIMNKLQLQLVNNGTSTLGGVQAVVRLPINREATVFKLHKSESITLGPRQTVSLPVIVGGYADLPGNVQADVGVEIASGEAELVRIVRQQALEVNEGALVVSLSTNDFTRGASGKLKLSIENTSEVELELLTATSNGAGDSSELRFKLLDSDGNVLSTQPYKQALGANVVTLANGLTVARIAPGSNYVSDEFSLHVPAASPNNIRVRLEVDKLRYHSGQDDEVQITGRGSERAVSLLDTAYYGEVNNVEPTSSFGDVDVIISGRALERLSATPLPNTRLKLILNQQGFERNLSVVSDSSGNFNYRFKPTLQDSGNYRVSAVHPDITDRPEQKGFIINRVTVGPTPYKLDLPKNVPFTIPLVAQAGVGTAASNLRLSLNDASQLGGHVPAGISLDLPSPVTLASRQSVAVPVVFHSSNDALPSGSLILDITSDEHAITPLGQVRINYSLSDASPYLVSSPNIVETGLAIGSSQIETVSFKNNGLKEALNLEFTLTKANGSPAPSWASIASQANGTLAVGAARSVDLSFAPPEGVQEGVVELKLNVRGDNVPSQSVNVYASVTQSGQGSVLFKASDIYTARPDKNGGLIPGLANANITVQNEEVATVSQELNTDAFGEALFQNLPAGRYKFRAKASNHQEIGGRLIIKPGVSINQPIFLDYNLITVEWSVREVTIQDRYEITLNATFETDVPAAVVVMQPASVNLPKMNVGDVYYGELVLTNHGLIRADKVKQRLPTNDAFFRFEYLVEVPGTLAAKQRVTIPYRVVALQSLEGSSGNSSGGGCYSYSNRFAVDCEYSCANGNITTCGTSTSYFSRSNSSCGGGGSGGAGGGGGGGFGGGGGGIGGAAPSTTVRLPGEKCVYIPKGECKTCQPQQ